MVGPILESLAFGKVLIIDEIDSSLHPELSLKLVGLFNSEQTNPNGAQLVFTTHDTHLLANKALRRDEIWFTEKSKGGETQLYPLSEIKTRNTDNLQKGYLQGRYGAIPFLGNIDKLFTAKKEG
jgi:AAA15 family ATPase/GTPase